ncbi:hypothetical protein [Hasllibacter sp. MH4015]|uniref:hypothetical protein n=1 Tax=Hasllibacter sp. MH4015 TaxID=2854029 RepID=UPI001CD6C741|nr:hypothetical protein [Hasllibacter sp. MH4015]
MALAGILLLAGCEGFVTPTDGSLPLLSQRPDQTIREDGGIITVDGTNFLVTNVTHLWIEDGRTGPGFGSERANRFLEVQVRNRTVRCENDEDCVRRVRQTLQELNADDYR